MDQKIRARNFEARNKRIEKGTPAKGKGKPVSVERKQGECNPWNAKGKCTKGNACSFGHDEKETWKSNAIALSWPRTADEKRWEKSSNGKPLRGQSPSGKRSRRPYKDYISGKCTNLLCDAWSELQNRIGVQIR